MEIINKEPFAGPHYNMKNMTLLLVEVPDAPNPQNIKICFNAALLDTVDLHFVTNGAAVMAKVANSSVYEGFMNATRLE